jgi:hypothetical protein
MNYYEIKTDFYEFSHQNFITEIDGFDNPRAQIDWDEFLIDYLPNRPKKYRATIESGEEEVDFTTTFYGFSVISDKFAKLLEKEKISDCLIIPLIFNKQLSQPFYLLVDALRCDCVDEDNSEYEKYATDDPVRPDFSGRYSYFFKLIIDEKRAEGYDFFRLENYYNSIIVSQKIKDIYDVNHLTGASFTKVTLD